MTTNVDRYFRCMGNWSHSALLFVPKVNLSCPLCLRCSDIVFAAELFVDKVLGCAQVDHRIDRNLSFRAM